MIKPKGPSEVNFVVWSLHPQERSLYHHPPCCWEVMSARLHDDIRRSHAQVIRHYHGHLSGVYSLAVHPTLDVLMTGGRDSVCRVWDMRTKCAASRVLIDRGARVLLCMWPLGRRQGSCLFAAPLHSYAHVVEGRTGVRLACWR